METIIKIITINLPLKYKTALETLKDFGVYPTISEAVRIALRDFLSTELKLYDDLDSYKFKMYVRSNAEGNKRS